MQRLLIILGVALIAVGVVWPWLSRLPLGHLPGDIHVQRDGFEFHFPLTSCLLVSAIISLLIWLFRR
ncbi:MAG TPA: DUF2905 domain-containing protein [Aromatoleum sp.]|uniref:DUF2905 domain-containing protein n=1 Tax=Aromatoleum sp. TaxID=2307007 RepID=UPI002B4A1F93|nr:DUF2905 domain-containing protein [Aromatoleum sp.]HJV26350.1 DUF2905 domain-containing protein [Aromatoleum sp.]